MEKNDNNKAYYKKVYKSEKNRRSFLVSPEVHLLLKLEAARQHKPMHKLLEEIVKKYLGI